jgi:hypothetical protein
VSLHRPLLLALLVLSLPACTREPKGDDTAPVAAADEDGDGSPADEDCDDADASAYPSGLESCDGVDNNCDGTIDEGVTTAFYADVDEDGHGTADFVEEACEVPDGYVATADDCDDGDAEVYFDAPERCDEVDNDCDTEVDEDVLDTWYADADGDGYGEAASAYAVCDPPPGYVSNDEDCDDTEATALPGGTEVCDELDNNCDGSIDEGVTTTWYVDADGDGYGVEDVTAESCDLPVGYAVRAGDCDDGSGGVSPNAVELCDAVDNDCDGSVDEDDAADATIWYADGDGDGRGDAGSTTTACAQPADHVADDSDCDDGDAAVSPDAAERCDGVDDDCDGEVDEASATDAAIWYADGDGDGYGGGVSTPACTQPSGYSATGDDCDDGDADSNPAASETCDEADNDCDGTVDEGVTTTFYADDDGDGQGDAASTVAACTPPGGYVTTALDCDDTDATVTPSASEVCDGVDNDCDGTVDSDAIDLDTWFLDGDGDGYGDSATTAAACDAPADYVANDDDCDDDQSTAYPTAVEIVDGLDNNCDGEGLDGSYAETSSGSLEAGAWEFTSFSLGASATITVTGDEPLEIYVLGAATLMGSLDLAGADGVEIQGFDYAQAGGLGGGGGGGDGGDGGVYQNGTSTAETGGGAAGGGGGFGYSSGSGGGGGGQASAGGDGDASGGCYTAYAGGTGGAAVNSATTPLLLPGSGGGGGGYGTGYNSDGGGGGGGGGALYLSAASIDIGGAIYCQGGDGGGYTGTAYHAAGGGGGSGGTLWLVGAAVTVSGTILCDGGLGGTTYEGGHCGEAGDGGDGADGLITIDGGSVSVTGSVSPAYVP